MDVDREAGMALEKKAGLEDSKLNEQSDMANTLTE